jgi:hypothetical protein
MRHKKGKTYKNQRHQMKNYMNIECDCIVNILLSG